MQEVTTRSRSGARDVGGLPPIPLDTFHLSSNDPDEARRLCRQSPLRMTLKVTADHDRFRFSSRGIRLGPTVLSDFSFGAGVVCEGSDIGSYVVNIPYAGHTRSRHSGAEVTVGPRAAATYRPVGPFSAMHSPGAMYHSLMISSGTLEEELEALLDRPVRRPVDLAPVFSLTDGPARSWYVMAAAALEEGLRPQSLLRHPLIAERTWQNLVTGLLYATAHPYHDELSRAVRAAPPRAVRRAMETMEELPHHRFTVAELAGVAGVSVRTLQEGFRRHLGMAPMTYLQHVRLRRVHEELRTSDPERTTVAAVAHRWGFSHLGRFASAYRARYGLSPSATLRGGL